MNLYYLILKRNRRLKKSRDIGAANLKHNGRTWLGVQLEPGGSIYLEGATDCQPFRSRCDSPGWFLSAVANEGEIRIRFRDGERVVSEAAAVTRRGSFEPVMLPWPREPLDRPLDLEIECTSASPVFVGCHFRLDRAPLIARCRGKGVELGPGPKPQVLPGEDTDVRYVEQKSPAEWIRLYGAHYDKEFDSALEPLYTIGDAHRVPAEPGTLDFVFSSHVFEHLVNPLGHLRLWSELLRNGGEVLMVVPDYIGSKDFLVDATRMHEIRTEYEAGVFEPSMRHYEKYARARSSPGKAQAWLDDKVSVHMHYYSNENMTELLECAVSEGWYSRFALLHSRNAKDFHVILTK
jgi:predicted SAM-dependent methyltransferase